LILVPGLAFDTRRRRLGHGRGYYDRYITKCLDYSERFAKSPPRTGMSLFLRSLASRGLTDLMFAVALALNAQMVQDGEQIPTNEFDRLPDVLLTPDEEIQ